MSFTERYEVAVNYDGWRLDRFLADRMKRASRAKVARIIRANVTIEREGHAPKIKAGTIVRHGDVVRIERTERADPATPSLDSVRILARGASFVVLDKPPGMLVHRTSHEATRTVDSFLAREFGAERVEPVHRLDRDTSGVLLCGRGLGSIRTLRALFERSEPRKVYRAAVVDPHRSWPPGRTRSFDVPLGFANGSAVRIRVGEGDWECRTTATALGRIGDVAELEVEIERGRQHQIRAHLDLHGTPIVGDKLYGMGDSFFLEWLDEPGRADLEARLATRWHCLHAHRLEVKIGGVGHAFEAPLPEHWPAFAAE